MHGSFFLGKMYTQRNVWILREFFKFWRVYQHPCNLHFGQGTERFLYPRKFSWIPSQSILGEWGSMLNIMTVLFPYKEKARHLLVFYVTIALFLELRSWLETSLSSAVRSRALRKETVCVVFVLLLHNSVTHNLCDIAGTACYEEASLRLGLYIVWDLSAAQM